MIFALNFQECVQMMKEGLSCLENKIDIKKKIILMLILSLLLGVLSLLLNIQSSEDLSEQGAPIGLAIRLAFSYLLNGAPWAVLLIVAGYRIPKCWQAILLSIFSGFVALISHYGLGYFIGFFGDFVGENAYWFIFDILAGLILGSIGYLMSKDNLLGDLLKFTIPLGFIIEPFYLKSFWPSTYYRPVVAFATILSGYIELMLGLIVFIIILRTILIRRKVIKI